MHGATFTIHQDAPPIPADTMSAEEIATVFDRKNAAREGFIALHFKADDPFSRMNAAMVYDTEHAPRTTNKRQLEEIGIVVPASSSFASRTDAYIRDRLWAIIYGLARLGVYLTDTDSLHDRELLARLVDGVLIDEVSDIPPNADMNEYISLDPSESKPKVVDRDYLLPRPRK